MQNKVGGSLFKAADVKLAEVSAPSVAGSTPFVAALAAERVIVPMPLNIKHESLSNPPLANRDILPAEVPVQQ